MLKKKGKIKNPVIFNNVNERHAALLVFSSRNKLKLPFSSVLSPTGRLFNFFFFLAKGLHTGRGQKRGNSMVGFVPDGLSRCV